MGEYEVDADPATNRLYVRLEGALDEGTAERAMDEVLNGADRLDPGFDVINDISEYKPLSQEATEELERGRAGIVERGATAVVRVTGDSTLGTLQFERVLGDDEGLQVASAESQLEAEQLLEELRTGSADLS